MGWMYFQKSSSYFLTITKMQYQCSSLHPNTYFSKSTSRARYKTHYKNPALSRNRPDSTASSCSSGFPNVPCRTSRGRTLSFQPKKQLFGIGPIWNYGIEILDCPWNQGIKVRKEAAPAFCQWILDFWRDRRIYLSGNKTIFGERLECGSQHFLRNVRDTAVHVIEP